MLTGGIGHLNFKPFGLGTFGSSDEFEAIDDRSRPLSYVSPKLNSPQLKPKVVPFSTINCNASTQIEENSSDGQVNKFTIVKFQSYDYYQNYVVHMQLH